ncbi:MAG TPA: ATP-dependent DNA helicase, partial [Thermoanaerobaculia bacterium]|nr:ATP-dependent DNA helicase [Thermoanaerobaculia bacterium]
GPEEWCDRRLLARIHRATIERLRREIEPVTAADFLRFLFVWQRAAPAPSAARAEGPEGLAAILAQLEGFEAPAAAWEGEILPARLRRYDPAWLDALCFSGRLIWRRANPPARPETEGPSRRGGPVRATPIAFFARESAPTWEGSIAPPAEPSGLSGDARSVLSALERGGASFPSDLARATGLLPSQLESALGELAACGLATADGFAGLRALIAPAAPANRRASARGHRTGRNGLSGAGGLGPAGRWALLRTERAESPVAPPEAAAEVAARALLARYGVLFRKLLERESLAPPWRELLPVLRRLEARGELRGGRFVEGFSGEQFALPEAVGRLRQVRREGTTGELRSIAASDPLNLAGIVTPGAKLPAVSGHRILFRDGVPIAHLAGRTVRFLVDLDAAESWRAEDALRRPGRLEPSPARSEPRRRPPRPSLAAAPVA